MPNISLMQSLFPNYIISLNSLIQNPFNFNQTFMDEEQLMKLIPLYWAYFFFEKFSISWTFLFLMVFSIDLWCLMMIIRIFITWISS